MQQRGCMLVRVCDLKAPSVRWTPRVQSSPHFPLPYLEHSIVSGGLSNNREQHTVKPGRQLRVRRLQHATWEMIEFAVDVCDFCQNLAAFPSSWFMTLWIVQDLHQG